MPDVKQLIIRVSPELFKSIKQQALDEEQTVNELLINIISPRIRKKSYDKEQSVEA